VPTSYPAGRCTGKMGQTDGATRLRIKQVGVLAVVFQDLGTADNPEWERDAGLLAARLRTPR
jgi:hypothetical protein